MYNTRTGLNGFFDKNGTRYRTIFKTIVTQQVDIKTNGNIMCIILSYQPFQVAIKISLFLLGSYYSLQTFATKPYAKPVKAAFPKIFSVSMIIFLVVGFINLYSR